MRWFSRRNEESREGSRPAHRSRLATGCPRGVPFRRQAWLEDDTRPSGLPRSGRARALFLSLRPLLAASPRPGYAWATMKTATIKKLVAREILDSRGNPT